VNWKGTGRRRHIVITEAYPNIKMDAQELGFGDMD
jgi:hypothetical protein